MTQRTHRLIGFSVVIVTLVGIVLYVCSFKLIDSDYWWHVKAGELMWKSKALIAIEPFSYVLAGKPYGALHEWLAQIVFYLLFSATGVIGAILLRGIATAVAAILILSIDLESAIVTAPLIAIAVYTHRASLMVRPQLFTIVLLCLSLATLFRYVRRREHADASRAEHKRFLVTVLGIQILWVNLHGASAIFGVLLVGGLALQGWVDWIRADVERTTTRRHECRFRFIVFGCACLAMFASPNFLKTFVDMYQHRFDGTIPLVREWMPLIWHDYATDVLPFGLIAAALILLRRREWVLCGSILIVTFFLSLQAYRHCIIFVLVSLGLTIFQLAAFAPWIRIRERLMRFSIVSCLVSSLLLLALWFGMYERDLATVFRNGDFGFGVHMPVSGAADFVEREKITGTLFNTYNEGGYLLFRFAPERKIFADGRNIEYGYPFIQKILDAGTNPARWREIDTRYRFTYAIVEFKSMPEYGMTRPYISNFEQDPSWVLVYLDDEATVYVRNLPQNAAIIKKYAYSVLTPSALEFTDVLDALPAREWPMIESELLRAARESPGSIKPRLILGNRYIAQHRLDAAETVALQALQAQPYHSEIYELLGRISVERQDWAQAGEYLERASELVSVGGPAINYDYLAMVFSKAGENDKAEVYHRKAVRAGQASPVIGE